jgi:serine-type D-Ala-D-Ala carboxypeptidase (penicillin-binding protein 5/6)
MLIPITIGLFISTIFLNLGMAFSGFFLPTGINQSPTTGKVLGAVEYQFSQFLKFNQPVNKLPENPTIIPRPQIHFDLAAENGIIFDCQSDNLFFAKKPDQIWPIASITKLFTAYTFLDYNPGWETDYIIKAEDKREGGKIYLFTGDKVKVKDLFYFSLVGSDNTATAALVHATGLSENDFIAKMNDKIKGLGFKNTSITDVAGLGESNVSTAREIAEFANLAFNIEEISRASLTKKYEFTTQQGRKKLIQSTNELLNNFPDQEVSILGGKTGHINSSGFCLVSKFKDVLGRSIVTVILGADSEESRFKLTRELVDLYYKNIP